MKILWLCFVWPEPHSSAAGFRTQQLIDVCREVGHEVRVSSACQSNQDQTRLEQSGIKTIRFQPNDSNFDIFLREYNPEVVVFDRFMIEEQFGWRVKEQCPHAVRVLDTIDLHSLRRARQRAVESGPLNTGKSDSLSSKIVPDIHSEDFIREVSSIYRCDLSLIISDVELALLRDRYNVPAALMTRCHFFYPSPELLIGFENRKNFVAIGNFNHAPNADSFRLLHKIIWPLIREELALCGVSDTELHIYGAYPSQEYLKLDNAKSGFRVKGWTPNAIDTLAQYRVNLAPLRFGAGLKGKISDGWYAGTPCVATPLAAEGMHAELPFGGYIEDDCDALAARAVALYQNRGDWEQAQANGISIIKKLFQKTNNARDFLCSLELAIEQRDNLRLQNVVGAMLWHNQHRSTEYFSRWIELKNRSQI